MLPDYPDGFHLDSHGHAIPQADLLSDWFAEHPDDDALEGDPETWPREYDSIRAALGPAYFPRERFVDLPEDVDTDLDF
jgi:hypothetical protein